MPNSLAPDTTGPTICIGEILVEIMATTIGSGFLTPQPLTGPYPSGAPAIFINQCGRIGGSAALIACVGDDDFGRINTARLARDGVDISAITTHKSLPTGTAFVRYRPDGTRDFIFNLSASAAGSLTWSAQTQALTARAGHLHVMGTFIANENMVQIIDRAATIIKSNGGTLSLDPNIRKELASSAAPAFARILGQTDLLLPSADELYIAAGTPPDAGEAAALQSLFATGISEVVLKRGAHGASAFLPDGTAEHVPPFMVQEQDPTGAGDCFGGAYVACRRLGLPLAKSLLYANAAGARSVTFQGPMEGAGSRAQLDEFIAKTQYGPAKRP
ncbi:MAG: sugar kinase [Rhodobacteraceae bacterium]|nr:sugar kinase [Paracoccaceae bacterium]